MKQDKTYLVREFARLAGVTVRTLHYYDQADLLKPSAVNENGFRLYRRSDLWRLQQIMTLKHMGFALKEIKVILDNPSYDVRNSLKIQKEALDRQITALQQVSKGLGQTLAMLDSEGQDEIDWTLLQRLIYELNHEDKWQWVREYYTDEQLAKLEARREHITQQQLQQWQREWEEVYADFRKWQDLPPDAPQVQAVAARMAGLLDEFTQGDEDMALALERLRKEAGDRMPTYYQLGDPALQEFACAALKIYRANN